MTEIDITLPRKNFHLAIREDFPDGITGIYGASGSGKTSLLHAISGLEKPTKGFVRVNGKTLFDSKESIHIPVEKRNIGYVFQEGRLFPHMTVEKNLLYGLKNHVDNKVSFDDVIELLDLRKIITSKPSQISGGERQRTALGRTLLSSPDILLLDEPFSAVDTNLRKLILPFIIGIQERVQIPILVVSHDLPDLLKLTNKLLVINEGSVLGHGDYYDLLKNESVANIFGTGSVLNAVKMKVEKSSEENRLTILSVKNDENKVKVKCEKSRAIYKTGQKLKIFVNADDIALSNKKLDNVTIQNQLKGTVLDIIPHDASLLCIIDVGFKLAAEITIESQKNLNIEKGSIVWCLFKSVAIDVLG